MPNSNTFKKPSYFFPAIRADNNTAATNLDCSLIEIEGRTLMVDDFQSLPLHKIRSFYGKETNCVLLKPSEKKLFFPELELLNLLHSTDPLAFLDSLVAPKLKKLLLINCYNFVLSHFDRMSNNFLTLNEINLDGSEISCKI